MVRNCRRLSRSAAKRRPALADRRVEHLPDEVADVTVRRAGRGSPGGGMSTCSRAPEHDAAEHAADRLGEAVGGVLGGRARHRESRNPRPARGARAREAKRWMTSTARRPTSAMKMNTQQAVIGAAALGNRHDRQPGQRRLRGHAGADAGSASPGASASMTKPGRMPASRQSAANANMAASEARSISLRLRRNAACAAGRGR